MADDDAERRYLKRARWRVGLASAALMVAGLALLIANVLTGVGGVLAIVGVIGLNLVRVAH